MPVRVELIAEAAEDLRGYAHGGNLLLFLAKLVRLEGAGNAAGQPLGGDLAGFRKIIVGDRNWRIVYTTDATETVATVWVIGDRDDDECYRLAQRRLHELARTRPETISLAAMMLQLQRDTRQTRRRRR